MTTNLSIDNDLLQQALEVGVLKTKRDTVNLALKEESSRRLLTFLELWNLIQITAAKKLVLETNSFTTTNNS